MFVWDARPGHIEIACMATRYPLVPVMTRAVDAGCRAGRAGMLPAAKLRVKPMPYRHLPELKHVRTSAKYSLKSHHLCGQPR